MLRRRRLDVPEERSWQQRTITLIGTREQTMRVCDEWAAESWQVMAVDEGPQTPTGQVTHVVRVAVPPPGWRTDGDLLQDLEA